MELYQCLYILGLRTAPVRFVEVETGGVVEGEIKQRIDPRERCGECHQVLRKITSPEKIKPRYKMKTQDELYNEYITILR